jgi:hypothetical protein
MSVNTYFICLIFEVSTTMTMKITVFWDTADYLTSQSVMQ